MQSFMLIFLLHMLKKNHNLVKINIIHNINRSRDILYYKQTNKRIMKTFILLTQNTQKLKSEDKISLKVKISFNN